MGHLDAALFLGFCTMLSFYIGAYAGFLYGYEKALTDAREHERKKRLKELYGGN